MHRPDHPGSRNTVFEPAETGSPMAEIKSTLDLVLERTRNLVMTEREKIENARVEFRRSLAGLLQRHQDRALTLKQFRQELVQLQEQTGISDVRAVIEEIAARMDPDSRSEPLFEILAEVCGVDGKGFESILDDYTDAVEGARQSRIERVRDRLLKVNGISGAAVRPCLEGDKEWEAELRNIRDHFIGLLNEETKRVLDSLPA